MTWVYNDERLPEPYRWVTVACDNGKTYGGAWYSHVLHRWGSVNGTGGREPYAWFDGDPLPKPPPPKEEK
jgi:hypothetical protein